MHLALLALSALLALADPRLGRRPGRSQLFVLPGGIAGVQQHLGCGSGSPGVLVRRHRALDRHPNRRTTPSGESIAEAARIVHAKHCQTYALAPDGEFMGLGDCKIDFDAGLYERVDWTQVELLSIQAQGLLSESCTRKLTIEDYAKFVSRVATCVRSKNPSIKVVTQVSFRYTQPATLIAAMRRVASEIDGFYVVCPAHSTKPCNDCSAANLATVLRDRDRH